MATNLLKIIIPNPAARTRIRVKLDQPGQNINRIRINVVRSTSYITTTVNVVSTVCNKAQYTFGFNGQMKVDEVAGVGNHYSALYWEYDPRTARRWNVDPVLKDAESPYLCFNGNPIANSDKNGDDGKTAAIIFAATQEAAAAAAVTWVGAPVAVGIEVVGGLWATYELLKDVPVQIPQAPAPAQQQQPVVAKAESKDVEKKANPNAEVKSRSEGAHSGPRAGKPKTKSGKNKVWEQNKESKGGKNECENCGAQLQRSPQSKKGEATPDNAGQVDHIYPESKGGDGTPWNGQLLCPDCNQAKSNNLPIPKPTE